MKTIALISPNKSAYSETFIQAHRRLLRARVVYYYNGALPHCCEGQAPLQPGRLDAAMKRLRRSRGTSLQEDMLLRSFRRNRVEKVFAEYGPTGAAVLNVCQRAGLPLIVHFHGYDISVRRVVERYREQYARMFDYAESIVAVSKPMVSALVECGAAREKITYAPYGPQDGFFHVNPLLSDKTFAAAGRFVDKKAPYYTVLAFARVLKSHPDARLYFAGDGPLLNACRNIARYHGCANAVTFPGVVAPPALQNVYARARGFVQHSITADDGDMEGTPVAVLEAAAAGLPVVATQHAGIPEVVINGTTGLLVSEHDVAGMADAMLRLLDDRDYAMRLGRQARQHVRDNFSLEKHIAILNALIDR